MYLGMEVIFKCAIRNPFKFSSDPLFNKKLFVFVSQLKSEML